MLSTVWPSHHFSAAGFGPECKLLIGSVFLDISQASPPARSGMTLTHAHGHMPASHTHGVVRNLDICMRTHRVAKCVAKWIRKDRITKGVRMVQQNNSYVSHCSWK